MDKRLIILNFAKQNGGNVTKKQALQLIGGYYYCNAAKYVGEILSKLVNNKTLIRIKPGVFKINDFHMVNMDGILRQFQPKQTESKNQIKLL